ncbi:hypothetical protein DPMN_181249 [Dreissena polymorpha]|uniref:Uncharacterized protein n=1 Tax=Dreissena polymorpha TaxID=45954 RepID=A0A9D4I546_DREPO|nr:hypothetical protein DPMN_181249 [Dreissena polymorpha]
MRRITQKLCSSGDSVCGSRGTLGGFVKKKNLPTVSPRDHEHAPLPMTDTLVALVSKHATQGLQFLTWDTNPLIIGQIEPEKSSDREMDILPVDVYDTFRHLCDTAFRIEHNARMTFTRLRKKEEIQDLIGAPVHIWGAHSRPGLGILVRHELRTRNGLWITVRDRTCAAPFAQPGDSGAMVCFYDPHHGGILYAIAMVVEIMRSNNGSDPKYTAQIVDDSLQKLSIWNGCEYKFIEDD